MDQVPDDRVKGIAGMKVLHAKYMLHIVVEGGILAIVQQGPGILLNGRGMGQQVTGGDVGEVFVLVNGRTIPS